MDIRQLSPTYFVSPQINPGDMDALRAAGITRILCNRPDSEVPPSHQAAAIGQAAEAAGIGFALLPLTHQTMGPENIASNRALGLETGDTVLAYCASGTRSTIAWALGQAGTQDPETLIDAAQKAGYDLAHLRGVLAASYC